jgi:hypothetical protein
MSRKKEQNQKSVTPGLPAIRTCEHGTPRLIHVGTPNIWVGKVTAAPDVKPGTVILNLSGSPARGPVTARGILPLSLQSPVIEIRWADFSIPALDAGQWTDLAVLLSEQTDIFICCDGCHGRTGTALAILAGLWKLVPENVDPVAWVRKQHCEEAVETTGQLKYVEKITGLPVNVGEPKKSWAALPGSYTFYDQQNVSRQLALGKYGGDGGHGWGKQRPRVDTRTVRSTWLSTACSAEKCADCRLMTCDHACHAEKKGSA